MKSNANRDNAYWARRLEKDGHSDLLAQIEAGEITVYAATLKVGFRKTAPSSPAAKLSYHWDRANHEERKRFVLSHLKDVNRVLLEVADDIKKAKAQKPSD